MKTVEINGRPLTEFSAELVAYSVGPCEFDSTYTLPLARIIPVSLKSRVKLRSVAFTLDFSGQSDADIALAISKFTANLFGEVHLDLPDGFSYWGALKKIGTPEVKAPWIQQVTFTLMCFRHLAMQRQTVTGSTTIFAEGNVATPMVVTIRPDAGTDEVTFCGITVKDLERPVTIDGVYTTILDADGNNRFGHSDIKEWPTLSPGDNTITVSGAATFEISYYPIFL